jgi:hypothetical protein
MIFDTSRGLHSQATENKSLGQSSQSKKDWNNVQEGIRRLKIILKGLGQHITKPRAERVKIARSVENKLNLIWRIFQRSKDDLPTEAHIEVTAFYDKAMGILKRFSGGRVIDFSKDKPFGKKKQAQEPKKGQEDPQGETIAYSGLSLVAIGLILWGMRR